MHSIDWKLCNHGVSVAASSRRGATLSASTEADQCRIEDSFSSEEFMHMDFERLQIFEIEIFVEEPSR